MKLQGFAFISEIVLGERKLAAAAPGTAAAPPQDPRFVPGKPFQVAKTGTFHSPVYGEIDITPLDLATMYRNFKTLTPLAPTQLPIDYDHLSDEPQKPEDGKAAGWVEDLQIRDGGNTLWCVPKWTKRAAQLIAEGAYRWCSPYFLTDYMDKASGEKVGHTLKAIAITNRPFLEGMQEIPAPAIAASDKTVRRTGPALLLAVPVAAKQGSSTKGLASSEKLARVEQPRRNTLHSGGTRSMKESTAEAALSEVAPGTELSAAPPPAAAPGITCPHCGAPVKHVGAAPPAAPPVPPAAHAPAADAMDEAGGDADALDTIPPAMSDVNDTDAGAGDSGDSELSELSETSTGSGDDTSVQHHLDKSQGVEAAEAALGDDATAEAALDDSTELAEAGQPKKPTPEAAAMSGVHVPPAPPKPAPKPAPPAPQVPHAASMSETDREIRQLRETTARLEKQLALNEQKEQVRAGRSLLRRGLQEGKLTPKMIGTPEAPTHTRRFAMRDPKGFQEWLAKEAPIVVSFAELGTSKGEERESAAGTAALVDQSAKALMSKDDSLDYRTATLRVLSSDRSLSERYDREMSGITGPREERPTSRDSAITNRTAAKK